MMTESAIPEEDELFLIEAKGNRSVENQVDDYVQKSKREVRISIIWLCLVFFLFWCIMYLALLQNPYDKTSDKMTVTEIKHDESTFPGF